MARQTRIFPAIDRNIRTDRKMPAKRNIFAKTKQKPHKESQRKKRQKKESKRDKKGKFIKNIFIYLVFKNITKKTKEMYE